ncbi:serine/threonine protein kinase [Aeromicrobium sp. Marseille-Q0843]|uniref:non-specific serine/threonine protein kinase n=1 Tax=Aeromicrobium phoceense TaxID=2754045 RepID=A0A838XJ78_9ACTN|nr:serine/threonine-protein kinase [Aeromicrobium phoceense]MBA4608666.1 serine/threonine protein kinase [Aeromicrobium phoceense]
MSNDLAPGAPAAELPPGLVGLSELGGGLHHEVWLAYDESRLAPVVVKILRPELVGDADAVGATLREIDVLARLAHPSIVRLYDFDDAAERPYMVQEHLDGPTLSSLIFRDGPVQLHQLLPLALELAGSVHYLHTNGLLHLDVKPSNVIMGAPAKLIDLSLTLDLDSAAALDYPVGSDEYMPPEQCDPLAHGPIGPAADVWSIGATLYRAAVGHRAWRASDEDRWPQLTARPKPMPDFVPGAIRDLVMDCLAFDPAARPTTLDLVERIEPLMAALPTARLAGFSLRR